MLIQSWAKTENTINSTEEIIDWVKKTNDSLVVNIDANKLSDSSFWFHDEEKGIITNNNNSFFLIQGIQVKKNDEILMEQPIILQNEIGYLGVICKEIKGTLYFLMQAKIEPGNINKVQISPTIQATKSNFTRKHGGDIPAYLEYFMNVNEHMVIVDQIQSEQSSRFYKKRNRNIIIKVNTDIEILPSHRWMTLGQMKQLMKYDNLVNMDTRTVLSCLPYSLMDKGSEALSIYFKDSALYRSIFERNNMVELTVVYNYINNYKMFDDTRERLVPLSELGKWDIIDEGIHCKEKYSFSVKYFDIEVEGREVRKWTQPLFKAEGIATFGLLTSIRDGVRKFLVHAEPEIGCFDKIELGSTIQREAVCMKKEDIIQKLFLQQYERRKGILYDVILSEEGGRFYHEQNRNIIMDVCNEKIPDLPEGYFWVSYSTLNILTQVNNCVNIQLRNLLSLLEV